PNAKHGRERQYISALKPLPWVEFVLAGLARSSKYQGMGRLHQQSSGSSEQHRGLPVDLPGDRMGAEQSRLAVEAVDRHVLHSRREPNIHWRGFVLWTRRDEAGQEGRPRDHAGQVKP